MEVTGGVFLDYEAKPAARLWSRSVVTRRFGGLLEIPLLPVLRELSAGARLRLRRHSHLRALGGLSLLGLGRFASGRDCLAFRANRALLARSLFQARAQTRHEVDDSAVALLDFGLLELRLLALHLRLDDSHQ